MRAVTWSLRCLCALAFSVTVFAPPVPSSAALNPGDIIVGLRDFPGDRIYRIDPQTGEKTLLSQTYLFPASGVEVGSGPKVDFPMVTVDTQGNIFASGTAYFGEDPSSSPLVVRVDAETGDRTLVVHKSLGSGPAWRHPYMYQALPNGLLFAYAEGGVQKDNFFLVDPATGNRTLLPEAAFDSGPLLGYTGQVAVTGDGKMLFPSFYSDHAALLWLDPQTGERRVVSASDTPDGYGSVGTGPAYSGWSATFAPSGELYVLQEHNLLRVDPVTGDRALVSSWDPADPWGTGPAAFGLDLLAEPDGSLITMGGDDFNNALIRIDPLTGNRSIITSFTEVNSIWSIAIVPHPVPEPATLVLAGSAIIAFAVVRRCRLGQGSP